MIKQKINPKKFSIGLDLGGTKLASALVNHQGQIIEYKKTKLDLNHLKNSSAEKKQVITLLNQHCLDYKKQYSIETSSKFFAGIGLASTGPLNVLTGELIDPSHFKNWKRFNIINELKKSLNRYKWSPNIYFQNDAIASAYAEKWVGAAKNCKTFAVITVGTGIGTGVIINNAPCQTNGMGSEWGLMLADLKGLQKSNNDIQSYTTEGIASGTALLSRARLQGFNGNSVEELVALHRKTNQYQYLFDDMAWALASLCYNLSLGFHLEKIIFSGGLIKIKDLYWEQTKSTYKKMISSHHRSFAAPLLIAKVGNNAGILGGASLPYIQKN